MRRLSEGNSYGAIAARTTRVVPDATGCRASTTSGGLARAFAVEQAAEVLEREQVDVDAREEALAHEVLQLRRVEVLQVLLHHAVHAGDLHLAAALLLLHRRLHGERFEQAVVGERGAHLAHALEIALVLRQELL